VSWRREPALVDPLAHPRKTVSVKIAARYLEIDERTLRKLIGAKRIACTWRGRLCKLEVSEIAAYEERERRRELR
jgi:hypothetical protein